MKSKDYNDDSDNKNVYQESDSLQVISLEKRLAEKDLYILKSYLNSIQHGGQQKLQFKTSGAGTCSNLCQSVIVKGTCNHGQHLCEVRHILQTKC